jgi:acyl carrier protein
VTQKKKADEAKKEPKRGAPATDAKRDAAALAGVGDLGARVVDVIARVMNAPAADLRPEIRFVEDLHADSLRVMELVLELQEEFGIEIPDESLDKIRSVGDAVGFVKGKLGG